MPAHQDPDDLLIVLFRHLAVENPLKTLEAGRPIFDDVEHCEIRAPGSKDVKVFPATAFARWVDDPFTGRQYKQSYAERFRHQYQQFKARSIQTTSGTPLEHAPFLSEARRAELKAQNVYTVEALSAIEGAELKNLGPGGRDMKNHASEFIEESRKAAPNKQMLAELEALKARNAILEEDAATLKNSKSGDEFDDMTLAQLKEYITTHTGQEPIGTLNRKTLARMAANCRPEKVA